MLLPVLFSVFSNTDRDYTFGEKALNPEAGFGASRQIHQSRGGSNMPKALDPAQSGPGLADGAGKSADRGVLAFSLPGAPLLAMTLPAIIYLPPYYSGALGFDLALVASAFFLARMLDLAIDPSIGAWQDRTVSSIGRRKLWMVVATAPTMALIWWVYIGLGPGTPFWLLLGGLFSLQVCYSVISIAHLSWAAELRPEYHARTRLLGGVQIAGVAGQIIILALPAVIQSNGWGDFRDSVHVMGWALIITLPLMVGACAILVPEPNSPPMPAIPWRVAFAALAQNRNFQWLMASDFLIGVMQGLTGGLFVFLFRNVLKLGAFSEVLLLFYFMGAMAGTPIWVAASRRFGKRAALQGALAWALVGNLLIIVVPPGIPWLSIVSMVFAGLAASAPVLLVRAMVADVVDEDDVRSGAARPGLFFGVQQTVVKLGIAAGPLAYVVLNAQGFEAKLGPDNSPQAIQALINLFAFGPAFLLALGALALHRYDLSHARQQQLRAQLSQRSLAGSLIAPRV